MPEALGLIPSKTYLGCGSAHCMPSTREVKAQDEEFKSIPDFTVSSTPVRATQSCL